MKQVYKGLLTAIAMVGMLLSATTQMLAQTPVLIKTGIGGSGFITTPTGLYFQSGGLLYKTDGTPDGTGTVKNSAGQTVTVPYSSFTGNGLQQVVANGRLYFEGAISGKRALMYVDAFGTAHPVDVTYNGDITQLFVVGNQLYFTTSIYYTTGNVSLFRTTGDGTRGELVGSYPIVSPSLTVYFAVYNGQLYFLTAKNSPDFATTRNFQTLWRIPLPATNAVAVADYPISYDNGQRFLITGNGYLYIGGSSSQLPFGLVLYQSDGTAAGTTLLSQPSSISSDYTRTFRVENGQLYFATFYRSFFTGLYKINSATKSVEVPTDIFGRLSNGVGSSAGSMAQDFITYKDQFYFSAYSSALGRELWRSDGILIKDIQTGVGDSDPQSFFISMGCSTSRPPGLSSAGNSTVPMVQKPVRSWSPI